MVGVKGRGALHRSRRFVNDLDRAACIPSPFDLRLFLDRLARHRAGRHIAMLPLGLNGLPSGVCGLWIALTDHDVVVYPDAVPVNHRDHIVMHEVGHMLAGHRSGSDHGRGALSSLTPDLDPTMVRMVLGRSVYDDVQEREAELIASLILERTLRPVRSQSFATGDRVVRRMQQALGL